MDQATRQRKVRIASSCVSTDDFVTAFGRFYEKNSIFIVTKKPAEQGSEIGFSITLKGGESVLAGTGRVVASYTGKEGPHGRSGMRLEFLSLDERGREVAERLSREAQKGNGANRRSASPDAGRSEEADREFSRQETKEGSWAPSAEAPAAPPPAEEREPRTQGAPFVLEANPFSEVEDVSLEVFVECHLEEASEDEMLDDAKLQSLPGEHADTGLFGGPTIHDSAPPAALEPTPAPEPPPDRAVSEPAPAPEPAEQAAQPAGPEPAPAPEPPAERPAQAGTEPAPAPLWKPLVVACAVTVVLSLLLSFAIWG